jgi:hypothetical protein
MSNLPVEARLPHLFDIEVRKKDMGGKVGLHKPNMMKASTSVQK